MTSKSKSTPRDEQTPTFAEDYLDIDHWPYRWAVASPDLAFAERVNDLFKIFLAEMLEQKRPRRILRQYRDHLCTLGEQVIRRTQDMPALRKTPVERLLIELLDDDRYRKSLPPMAPAEQRHFDSTCKALYRFLVPTLP